jgi:FMN phosphatase YigB (HAD superfamily)
MLELLEVAAADAVMVGDTVEDDVEGALAVGMRAVLVDREGRYPERESIDDLRALLNVI